MHVDPDLCRHIVSLGHNELSVEWTLALTQLTLALYMRKVVVNPIYPHNNHAHKSHSKTETPLDLFS